MMASCSAASAFPFTESRTQARFMADAESAFRDALTESFEALAVGDRNLVRFHYFHGIAIEQLAELCCSPRAVVIRQLARIRERMLRDTRRGLAARLTVDKHELDRLLEVARSRFDLAMTRVLRT